MKARIIGIAICLVVIVIFGIYWYQSFNGPLFPSVYKFGQEIKGFPVDEMSLTVYNMTTSQTVNVPNMASPARAP